MNRYSRNSSTIDLKQQEILASKKVLIIGLGGLGSHVVEGLARIGIKNIGVCDFDVIEITNLNRQLLALEKTIGIPKLDLAIKRIKEIDSSINITSYPKYPNNEILTDLESYDLVVDCLDSISLRKQLENDCLLRNKQLVYGTIAGNYGYFGVISNENELILYQEEKKESIEKKLGNPYYIVSTVASMQILLVVKVLLNLEYLKKGFYSVDLDTFSIEEINLK